MNNIKFAPCPSGHRYVRYIDGRKVCVDCGAVIETVNISDELADYIKRRLRTIEALVDHPRLTK
jgi:transcription initiation factor TFIIIB Brf1 subunit/transcription initiation factor TFIIB